ncbi:mitochondrial inner membrane protease subunit 2 isoform X3 [Labeo rohita]|uniref:Mitochondrial inner membrane protease subunit 2 isoform X3 n=1 Tax=Labeo rohita TaxID=84645 RepID=A0A498MV85_LABRO|nr:mitochondrial inner membrane protease subunit 2 isoform X3 [Labeo rohita]
MGNILINTETLMLKITDFSRARPIIATEMYLRDDENPKDDEYPESSVVYRPSPTTFDGLFSQQINVIQGTVGHDATAHTVVGREVEMSPLENASEVIENKTLIAQCQMRQMLNIKPLTMCLNGVIDAAVNGGLARYQEAMAQTGFGRRYFKAFVSGFFVAVPVTVTVLDRLAYVARVEGASMQPSLNPAGETSPDVVLLNRWSVRNYQVQRGDIVSVL